MLRPTIVVSPLALLSSVTNSPSATVDYILATTSRPNHHKRASKTPASNLWLAVKGDTLTTAERERLATGAPIESVLPNYSTANDVNGILQYAQIRSGESNEFAVSLHFVPFQSDRLTVY